MAPFDIFTVILVFLAAFSYLNARFVRIPPTIAYMGGALLISIVILGLKAFDLHVGHLLIDMIERINFSATVLYGVLAFLLFAGSLQLNIQDLAEEKWVILTLSTVGVLLSALFVGVGMYAVFQLLHIGIPFLYALIFGAIISPTDPVIVINLLKRAHIPHPLRIKVMGEALFNDGIAIVLFVVLIAIATLEQKIGASDVLLMVALQIIGSTLLGLLGGFITHKLLTTVDQTGPRILVTLGLVALTYDLAMLSGISGPLTVVIMGLFVRNYKGRRKSSVTFREMYDFWALLDEFLNAVLFLLMGLQLLALPLSWLYALTALISIGVVLIARYLSVAIPIGIFRFFRPFTKRAVVILTWVGMRGGVSLALALSLPESESTNVIWVATYFCVTFSTLVQGLTFKRFVGTSSHHATHTS
ncbi:MAG: sodium:proton antiporter [Verrucomicrobia bacterium]|nr:sodium:proton antiporter [Verrucomicrobiota bacterium]